MAERLPAHSLRTYLRSGHSCCLDPIRNRLFRVTPEEKARQRVVSWLLEKKRWPISQIETEHNCLRDGLGTGRIDIALLRPATRTERARTGADRIHAAHDGRLAYGRGGSVSRETVIERVMTEAPSLMKDGRVFLGRVSASKQIDWEDARDMVLRLSRYALVRDRVREAARNTS